MHPTTDLQIEHPPFGRGVERSILATRREPGIALAEGLRPFADARNVTVAQLAVAWVLARGDETVALVDAGRPGRIADAAAAAGPTLTADDLAAMNEAVPADAVAGERSAAPQMATLDSER